MTNKFMADDMNKKIGRANLKGLTYAFSLRADRSPQLKADIPITLLPDYERSLESITPQNRDTKVTQIVDLYSPRAHLTICGNDVCTLAQENVFSPPITELLRELNFIQ